MPDASIDLLFPAHLQHVMALADRALEREGCDGLVVYSGRPGRFFLDDHGPAFKANPHFLHWAPLQEEPDCFIRYLPGQAPAAGFPPAGRLLAQAAACADRGVDPRIRPDGHSRAGRGTGAARCRRIVAWPSSASRPTEFAEWGFSAVNPAGLLAYLHYHRAAKTPYELACLREASRLGAIGHVGRGRRVSRRVRRSTKCTRRTARPSACANRNCPTATSSRSARARRSCITRRSAAHATCRARPS